MEDNQKQKWVVGAFVLLLVLAGIYFLLLSKPKTPDSGPIAEDCKTTEEIVEVSRQSMEAVLPKDGKVKVIRDYYKCFRPARDELVAYQSNNSAEIYVRYIRALEGDNIALEYDKQFRNWNVKINGRYLTSQNQKYHFGSEAKPLLLLYQNSNKGKVVDKDVLLFADMPPGIGDSGQFGMLSSRDLIGKVILEPGAAVEEAPAVPVEENSVSSSPEEVKEELNIGDVQEIAVSPKQEEAAASSEGLLYRGTMNVENIKAVTPNIAKKIVSLGGEKAGSVELGTSQPGGNYFHFSLPEKNMNALLSYLKKYGKLELKKEKHSRVMPVGTARIILTVSGSKPQKK